MSLKISNFVLCLLLSIGFCLLPLEKTQAQGAFSIIHQDNDTKNNRETNGNFIVLAQDKPVIRELETGGSHYYRINLNSGEYLHVIIDQKGIGIIATLFAPNGEKLIVVNRQKSVEGLEHIYWLAAESGYFRLEISAKEKETKTGGYELRVKELRPANPQDISRIAAQKAFTEGDQGLDQQTKESCQQAIEKYSQALQLFRAAGDRTEEAFTLNNIGKCYLCRVEMQQSLDYYNQALAVYRDINDPRGKATVLNNIGKIYADLGERQKALQYYNQALPFLQEIGDRYGEAYLLNSISVIYASLDEQQQALDYYHRALQIFRALSSQYGEAYMLSNIGRVYSDLGEYRQALSYYEQALPIFRIVGEQRGEGYTLNNIGKVYANLEEYQRALEYYHQALPISRSAGDSRGVVRVLNDIGWVLAVLGEYQRALDNYNQVLPLCLMLNDRYSETYALINSGNIYARFGDYQQAIDRYRKALDISRTINNRSKEVQALYELARIDNQRGNLAEAHTKLAEAIKIIESLRTKIGSAELRASYFATIKNCYESYIDLLMQLHEWQPTAGYNTLALQASERVRARSLLELLGETRDNIRQGVPAELIKQENNLQLKLSAAANKLVQLKVDKEKIKQVEELDNEIALLTAELQQVQAQIRYQNPRYFSLTQSQPLSLKEIQEQLLDDNTLLLEYALGEEQSFLWVVTSTSIESHKLPKRAEIENVARHVYDLLLQTKPDGLTRKTRKEVGKTDIKYSEIPATQAEMAYWQAATRLSQILLGPVAGSLAFKRLLIVSDGALQYLPFGALPAPIMDKNGDSGKSRVPLLFEHEIINEPSASALAALRRELRDRKAAVKSAVVFADPVFNRDDARVLPKRVNRRLKRQKQQPATVDLQASTRSASTLVPTYDAALERSAREVGMIKVKLTMPRLPFSRREAEAIIKFVPPGEGKLALDFDANKATALSEELGQYRYLHFATHGMVNSTHPELSGLVLSLFNKNGQPQDGFLRLHEVYNLKLSAELVVLSACQTGLGKEIKGEGLIGLTRGFMYAGAGSVLASLWNIDDRATAELMSNLYYSLLREGMRPAQALRKAQISLCRTKRWHAPYYWAAFQLQGEP
ncbi:MAG: CHAT domain-containing protein [Acidobacteriota bacterium]